MGLLEMARKGCANTEEKASRMAEGFMEKVTVALGLGEWIFAKLPLWSYGYYFQPSSPTEAMRCS